MGLVFRILGPLEVENASDLGGPKPRTLLARLLLEPNRVVSYDELIEAVWPDEPPGRPRHTLQVYVSSLRRALGEDRIRSDPSGYSARVGPEELDLSRFEQLSAEGRARQRSGDAEGALSRLEEALSLWRGPPLGDVAPALEIERARLDELRLGVAEEELDAALALGRHEDVVARVEALVRRHPTRERLRRQLMLALYRSGRQAEALEAYRDARRTLVEELGIEPGGELRELEAAILRQDPALAPARAESPKPEHRVPAPATPFVGRGREVGRDLRLARRRRATRHAHGAGRIRQDAARLAGGRGVGRDVRGWHFLRWAGRAPRCGTSFPPRSRERSVWRTRAVLERRSSITSCRAPSSSCWTTSSSSWTPRAFVAGLLAEAPGLKLLVTSRHALRVYGEHEYPVEPLALEEEAVPLFLQRALAVGRRLEADEVTRELCRRLDCLPLAIELVATRTREVSLEDLASTWPRLEAAVGGMRDVPARQQTLRATIAWSYDLLDDDERRLFEALGASSSVVAACQDAEAVTGASSSAIRSLVDKNLVRRDGDRLAMLETIREYAVEKLEDSGSAEEVRRRHAEHFLGLAEAGEEVRRTPGEVDWWNRLDVDRDNLRAAFGWWLEHDPAVAGRLVEGVFRYWYTRGHYEEGALAYERVLDMAELSDPDRARLLSYAAAFEFARRRLERARTLAEESLELRRLLGDRDAIARSLVMLGTILVEEEAHDSALQLLEESMALARAVDDPVLLGFTSSNLAAALLSARQLERFHEVGHEALDVARKVGDTITEKATLVNLGLAAVIDDDPVSGAARFAESLDLARELGDPLGLLESIEGVAAAAAASGRAIEAARLLGAAEALAREEKLVLESVSRLVHDRALEAIRASLDEDRMRGAWSAGAKVDADEAAAEAAEVAAALVRGGPAEGSL